MQKLILFVCLFFSVAYVSAQRTATKRTSAKSSNHNNAVKLGVNTFFDTDEFPFNVAWETKVGANQSIQIGVLPRISTYNDDRLAGVGINFAYRKYISKNRNGIQGLFVSPVAKIGFLKDNNSYQSYNYTGNPPQPQYYTITSQSKITQYNLGVVFGHKWAYRSGFTFEASGGMGYYYTKNKYTSNNNSNSIYSYNGGTYSGILPQLQLSFGYAF